MKRAILASLLLLLSACGGGGGGSQAEAAVPFVTKKVACIGDSLTAGYIPINGILQVSSSLSYCGRIEYVTQGQWQGVNVGHPGFTTQQETDFATEALGNRNTGVLPTAAIIMLGANDVIFNVPLSTTEANYRRLIEFNKAKNIKVVLVSPPKLPPVNEQQLQAITLLVQRLATEYSVPFIDVFSAYSPAWTCHPIDLHLCEPFHAYLVQKVAPILQGM